MTVSQGSLKTICVSDTYIMIHDSSKLQLFCSKENNFMIRGHHSTRNWTKGSQDSEFSTGPTVGPPFCLEPHP